MEIPGPTLAMSTMNSNSLRAEFQRCGLRKGVTLIPRGQDIWGYCRGVPPGRGWLQSDFQAVSQTAGTVESTAPQPSRPRLQSNALVGRLTGSLVGGNARDDL